MKTILKILPIILLFASAINSQSLRIMTYNIRYDNSNDGENSWGNRREKIVEIFENTKADIIGIQEGLEHQLRYMIDGLDGYKFVGVGRDDGKSKGEYSAIIYNSENFSIVKSSTFWLSETPDIPSVGWDAALKRICTYALFYSKKNHQEFWVFNAHFDHIGEKARYNSAKLIVRKINSLNEKDYPVILTGDFNSEPESEVVLYLSQQMKNVKVYAKIQKGPGGTFNDFKFHQKQVEQIDYIFTSDDFTFKSYEVVDKSFNSHYPSDHFPVVAELKFK